MNTLYLIPFGLVFAMFAGMTYVVIKLNRWKALPLLVDYLTKPNTQNEQQQIQCVHCGSTDIQETGEWGQSSVERTFKCRRCLHKLYRSQ